MKRSRARLREKEREIEDAIRADMDKAKEPPTSKILKRVQNILNKKDYSVMLFDIKADLCQ